ncbi:hypothetical protein OIY81_3078 [Cryptosporidium canis]|nr:hypothetical protein OIY81_3078 [Cryptosporidium canis]
MSPREAAEHLAGLGEADHGEGGGLCESDDHECEFVESSCERRREEEDGPAAEELGRRQIKARRVHEQVDELLGDQNIYNKQGGRELLVPDQDLGRVVVDLWEGPGDACVEDELEEDVPNQRGGFRHRVGRELCKGQTGVPQDDRGGKAKGGWPDIPVPVVESLEERFVLLVVLDHLFGGGFLAL